MNLISRFFRRSILLIVATNCFSYGIAEEMDHSNHDEHAMHKAMLNDTKIKILKEDYSLPDVTLIDSYGKSRKLTFNVKLVSYY